MTIFSPDKIDQFRSEGYVAVPDMFTADEMCAMRVELERFKQKGLGRNVATDGDSQTLSQSEVNYQIMPLNNKSDLLRALPFAPKVIAAMRQLIGDPFVRQLDQIFLKPGRTGRGTDWHVDNAYFQISDPTKGAAMWIALHDANIANGTLHVIPRSHLETFEHTRDPDSNHHIHFQADETRAVPVELPAGGAVFFNYGIGHATKRNNTDSERAGMAYHFLRTDYVETARMTDGIVHITGPQATGGEREYGVRVAGAWEDEVRKLL